MNTLQRFYIPKIEITNLIYFSYVVDSITDDIVSDEILKECRNKSDLFVDLTDNQLEYIYDQLDLLLSYGDALVDLIDLAKLLEKLIKQDNNLCIEIHIQHTII